MRLTLLDSTYEKEELADIGRDVSEAFDDALDDKIPRDEHGFCEGKFRVIITWEGDT